MKNLKETASLGAKTGNKYNARVIKAGQGSSGFYSESMLQEYGPTAFPAGTHVYINHKSMSDEWERPERGVEDIGGVLETDATFNGDGLYATIRFTERALPLVEELKDHIGLSIYAVGEAEEMDGGVNVTKLMFSPFNSVDLVTRPGAGGAVLELMESYRETNSSARIETTKVASSDAPTVSEREAMTEEDITKIVEAVKAAITEPLNAIAESLKPAVSESVSTEPDLVAATEAALDAGLPKIAREKVVVAVKAGTTVAEAIAAEVAYKDALLKESAPAAASVEGVTLSGSGTKAVNFQEALSNMFGKTTKGDN